jgi:uncharacterized protein
MICLRRCCQRRATTLSQKPPTETATAHWTARLKLRQRRLASLKAAEIKLLGSEVLPVSISGLPKLRLHFLAEDLPLWDKAEQSPMNQEPLLIAPLDPIIYDRRIAEQLWDFDYRWEVYVPPEKRVRGYYALPLLHKDRMIGYADLKADRNAERLLIQSSQGQGSRRASRSLAAFLGLKL